ncbi:MAG: phosphatase PAP2 family protein [Duncaniella sp.]|nr:phosphatase PAP2 family protein [Duncaniella sp.]
MTDYILSLDQQFLLWANGSHTPLMDTVWWVISYRFTWIPLYCVFAWMLFRRFTVKSAVAILLTIGLMITLCDQISSHVIRDAVCRLRPSNPDNPLSACITLVDGYRSGRYGFPSSHAANTIGLATMLSLVMRRRWFTGAIFVWAVIVCYSRLYLGVHYPTDLLAGGCLGAAIALTCYMLLLRFYPPQPRR